jgi:hypothetical protein
MIYPPVFVYQVETQNIASLQDPPNQLVNVDRVWKDQRFTPRFGFCQRMAYPLQPGCVGLIAQQGQLRTGVFRQKRVIQNGRTCFGIFNFLRR